MYSVDGRSYKVNRSSNSMLSKIFCGGLVSLVSLVCLVCLVCRIGLFPAYPLPHAPHQWYFEPRSIQTTTRRQGHLKSQSLKSAQRKHFQTFWCATPSFIPQFLPCLGEGETEGDSLYHVHYTAIVRLE